MKPPRIAAHEKEIRGQWLIVSGRVHADENCRRIQEVTSQYLREVAADSTGWDRLYVDPTGGRFWELTHPESEIHGGGPPRLQNISEEDARNKYGNAAIDGMK